MTGAWIALGGAIGSVLRLVLGAWVASWADMAFPWATFTVNVTGSLALGFLSRALSPSLPIATRGFLTVGLCGGFTTFSTFDLEVLQLIEGGRRLAALSYALGSAVTCVVAVYAGYMIARYFRRPIRESPTPAG